MNVPSKETSMPQIGSSRARLPKARIHVAAEILHHEEIESAYTVENLSCHDEVLESLEEESRLEFEGGFAMPPPSETFFYDYGFDYYDLVEYDEDIAEVTPIPPRYRTTSEEEARLDREFTEF